MENNTYIVRSSVNPALILCTDGEFHAECFLGPGLNLSAKIYKTRKWASKVRGGYQIMVETVEQGEKIVENTYRVDVRGVGEHSWSSNGLRFPTEAEATTYAIGLLDRWYGADGFRVVPGDTPQREPTYTNTPHYHAGIRTAGLLPCRCDNFPEKPDQPKLRGTLSTKKFDAVAYSPATGEPRGDGPRCVTCGDLAALGTHPLCEHERGKLVIWIDNAPSSRV